MIIPVEVQCRTCGQVFCCAKCRHKHEDADHQEAAMIRKICYICNQRPFPLRRDTKITMNNVLIAHILKEHMPLRCNRCMKVFYSLLDLQQLNKCFMLCPNSNEGECFLEGSLPGAEARVSLPAADENKENLSVNVDQSLGKIENKRQAGNVARRRSVPLSMELQSLQESQEIIEEVDEALLTPLTKINLRWKRKSRQSFESMLSTSGNNNSSASSSSTSDLLKLNDVPAPGVAGARPKLVRSTSTPMYQWQLMPMVKLPNESYTATMGQMSSIHCSTESEADSRSDDMGASPPPPPPAPSSADELDKVRAIIRNRSKVAATPLRQVMSKSIQRAIAQHTTGAYSKMLQPGTQRKMSFNSTMSSTGVNNSTIGSPTADPLDLRTTPVLKRESNVSCGKLTKVFSIDAGRSLQDTDSTIDSEYYEAHRDLDSLRANESADRENRENQQKLYSGGHGHGPGKDDTAPSTVSYLRTPKSSGAVLKKVISFHTLDDSKSAVGGEVDEAGDVWGTPCSMMLVPPRSFSCSAVGLGNTFQAEDHASDTVSDEVFFPAATAQRMARLKKGVRETEGKQITVNGGGSKLWSIVSNVIRLASRSDVQEELATPGAPSIGGGLVQRAVSFADYLKSRYSGRTSSSGSDEYRVPEESSGKKRRRVVSVASRTAFAPATMAIPMAAKMTCSPAAKRKRIQSRQPIHRSRPGSDSGIS
ncbi:mitosis initiation protein fs(1)Ya [Anopheles cruzii]|uniref:mitosis initiation protein fs(1)Ya n=1 Tax=Anopheles cruzii TaxID=68878 RepID=UPI0022EC320C|nr:mitosis initiation protein fs(1)Ya [Anopheles cruzii]